MAEAYVRERSISTNFHGDAASASAAIRASLLRSALRRTTVLVMADPTRAAQAIAAVLKHIEAPSESNGYLRVLDSWTEGTETICLVYEGWWSEGKLGLRRKIDADLAVDAVVGQILDAELGEPVGAMIDGVIPDANGVTWWEGEPREWWQSSS